MPRIEDRLQREVPRLLAELLHTPLDEVRVEIASPSSDHCPDSTIRVGPHVFLVQARHSGATAPVLLGIRNLEAAKVRSPRKAIPLLVVPYMGEVGRRLCEEAGVQWLDLSGNADIAAPNLRLKVDGRPNLFPSRGRPSSVFAPVSSRVARFLLLSDPKAPIRQQRMAAQLGMDDGFVSRIVARMIREGFVRRSREGLLSVLDRDQMLDAWREVYDFKGHHIVRGHISGRDPGLVLQDLARRLERAKIRYAATGLAAAWIYIQHATYRISTIYLDLPTPAGERLPEPLQPILSALGWNQDPRGSNFWLVFPKDQGVFYGMPKRHGRGWIERVHPLQVYLDLKGHPERAPEAADELRRRGIWSLIDE